MFRIYATQTGWNAEMMKEWIELDDYECFPLRAGDQQEQK